MESLYRIDFPGASVILTVGQVLRRRLREAKRGRWPVRGHSVSAPFNRVVVAGRPHVSWSGWSGPSPALRSDEMIPARFYHGASCRSDTTRSESLRPAPVRPRHTPAAMRTFSVKPRDIPRDRAPSTLDGAHEENAYQRDSAGGVARRSG